MSKSTNFAQRAGVIWMDGEWIAWKDATTHVLSHGLHYGSCVFEGERVYHGVIFKHDEHVARLFNSAKLLDMTIPFKPAEVSEAARQLVVKQGIREGYVRPVVWRGSEMMAVSAQQTTIHVAIACWEWPSYFKGESVRLDLADWRRPSADSAPVHSKAAGLYMICTLSKHEAEKKGYDDALMLDSQGNIAEATGANIFFVKDGALHTPRATSFLNGITRQTVMEIARAQKIDVTERTISLDELDSMDEVFLTGTAVEIMAVSAIGRHQWRVGDVTRHLIQCFKNYVDDHCGVR